jgi:epsilon-lactone hydrolase
VSGFAGPRSSSVRNRAMRREQTERLEAGGWRAHRVRRRWLVANFLGDGDRRDPYARQLYADLTGFPPGFLQAGADETLVDDRRMLVERARKAGVEVRFDVFPEMLHTFQMMAGRAPEADDAIGRLAEWVRPKLGLVGQSCQAVRR